MEESQTARDFQDSALKLSVGGLLASIYIFVTQDNSLFSFDATWHQLLGISFLLNDAMTIEIVQRR
jgi:hypothetical protein